MTPVEPWQYPVWILSALGAGMVLAARLLPQNTTCSVEGRAISGAGISYLALGCPICNKVVVAIIGVWGYPLNRPNAGQAALHGRFAGGRSRLGGWPRPPGTSGGFFFGSGFTMRSR